LQRTERFFPHVRLEAEFADSRTCPALSERAACISRIAESGGIDGAPFVGAGA
jgi:hypothetical protein